MGGLHLDSSEQIQFIDPESAPPSQGGQPVLKATLIGKKSEIAFVKAGDQLEAQYIGGAPRWIHYSVCAKASGKCSDELVVASPTTPLPYALKTVQFVPD